MMIYTAKFSRKKTALALVILGLLCAALILLLTRSSEPKAGADTPQLLTAEDCAAHLTSLGWDVLPDPVETLQFLLPEVLEEPYLSYNALQLSQGFDLSACCGKQLSRFTFTVTNYPGRQDGVQANLYLCQGQLVAGDILCTGENGFQVGLAYPKADA